MVSLFINNIVNNNNPYNNCYCLVVTYSILPYSFGGGPWLLTASAKFWNVSSTQTTHSQIKTSCQIVFFELAYD